MALIDVMRFKTQLKVQIGFRPRLKNEATSRIFRITQRSFSRSNPRTGDSLDKTQWIGMQKWNRVGREECPYSTTLVHSRINLDPTRRYTLTHANIHPTLIHLYINKHIVKFFLLIITTQLYMDFLLHL